jgi:integrase
MGDVLNRGSKDRPRWYVRFVDVDGQRKQRASHQPSRIAAQRFLAAIEARIAAGKVGIDEPTTEDLERRTITIKAVYARFIDEYAPPTIKDLHDYRSQTRAVFNVRILPALGARAAANVTRGDVERLRDDLTRRGYAAGSVRWTMSRLSRLYVWARRVGHIACDNPVSGIELPPPTCSLDYLSKAEVAGLLAYAEIHAPSLHPMIAFCVFSGARKGEAFGARWSDIDFDAGRVDINRSYELRPKSGKARHIPLHHELAIVLRRWRERCPRTSAGLLFPVEVSAGVYRMGNSQDILGLATIMEAASCHVPDKPWHSLRHTFASHAVMRGVSLYTVQRLLGHATSAMTERYSHLAPQHLAAELARLDFDVTTAKVLDIDDERQRRAAQAAVE